MDDFSIHLAQHLRRMPCGLPVQSICAATCKTQHIQCAFDTFNFSFILEGGGTYTFRGKTWDVSAPCVFIQWPGDLMDYGPSGKWSSWCELSLLYSADQLEVLQQRNLALERKPIWPVRRASLMREQVMRLEELVKDHEFDGVVDRIDRACELLIVESRLGENRPPLGRDEAVIRKIRKHVRDHYCEQIDFDYLACENHLSSSTFRRYWNRYVHMPPAQYVMHLRMREACRLLVETDSTIAEIADQLNFDDPLYFSRRFSQSLGMTASAYRKHNAIMR